jgi:hypothetical protein
MKKKQPKKSKEEDSKKNKSELEQEVEKPQKKEDKQIREIEEQDFEEFFEEQEFRSGSPSLGKINASPAMPVNLERVAETSPAVEAGEDKPFNYSTITGNKDEPKYQNYMGNTFSGMLSHSEVENLGKKDFERREVEFVQSSEVRNQERVNFEKYENVKRFDANELGKEKERREIKYQPTN